MTPSDHLSYPPCHVERQTDPTSPLLSSSNNLLWMPWHPEECSIRKYLPTPTSLGCPMRNMLSLDLKWEVI